MIHFMPMSIRREWFYMEQHNEDIGTKEDLARHRLQTADDI